MNIPAGYIPGQGRDADGYLRRTRKTHLYKGDFADPGLPMCKRGWNRDGGESYSIWRNNIGEAGICAVCLKRAKLGLNGVPSPVEPSWEDDEDIHSADRPEDNQTQS